MRGALLRASLYRGCAVGTSFGARHAVVFSAQKSARSEREEDLRRGMRQGASGAVSQWQTRVGAAEAEVKL